MRLNATRLGSIASSRSFGDQLDDLAGQVPSLDLNFAQNKSLIDDYSGTTLVTHTRASSGTYVGSDGVLRSAVTNLLLRSEDANTGFSKLRSSVSSDVIAAPTGTVTADKIVEDSTASATHFIYRYPTITANTTYTYSVFLKSAGRSHALIGFGNNIEGNGVRVGVDLSAGTVGTPFAFGSGSGAAASIQSFGNGWYRVVLSGIADTTSTAGLCTIYLATSVLTSGTPSYTGDGTSGIYVWGAQLEQSATVGEYIPTTSTINSAPRFDHNPTTGESLGLLVEEARTNGVVNSNSMTAVVTGSPGTLPTGWSAQGNSNGWTREVVGSGSIGALNYVDIRLSGTPTGSQFSVIFQPQGVVAASDGQSWAPSVYHQLVGGAISNIGCFGAANLWNSSSAFITSLGVVPSSSFAPTSTLQRYTGSGTISNAATAFINWGITFTCTIGNTYDFTIRFAGPQLEVGSFATSYIPTTTATA
jgi:hypothetical protein